MLTKKRLSKSTRSDRKVKFSRGFLTGRPKLTPRALAAAIPSDCLYLHIIPRFVCLLRHVSGITVLSAAAIENEDPEVIDITYLLADVWAEIEKMDCQIGRMERLQQFSLANDICKWSGVFGRFRAIFQYRTGRQPLK
jgi:hypothetical protein